MRLPILLGIGGRYSHVASMRKYLMETKVNLPDALFAASAAIAASDDSVTQKSAAIGSTGEVELPVIRSKAPGTMGLAAFDFDALFV